MYPAIELAGARHREMLRKAEAGRQAARLRKLHRASRRASRAERNLSRARVEVLRMSSELRGA